MILLNNWSHRKYIHWRRKKNENDIYLTVLVIGNVYVKTKSWAIRCSGLTSYVARLHSEETVKWRPSCLVLLDIFCGLCGGLGQPPWLFCTLGPQEDSHEACVSWPPPPWAPTAPHCEHPLTVFPSTLFVSGNQTRHSQSRSGGRLRSLSTRAGLSLPPFRWDRFWVGCNPPSSQMSLVGWSSDCSQRSSARNVPSVGFPSLPSLVSWDRPQPPAPTNTSTHIFVLWRCSKF